MEETLEEDIFTRTRFSILAKVSLYLLLKCIAETLNFKTVFYFNEN